MMEDDFQKWWRENDMDKKLRTDAEDVKLLFENYVRYAQRKIYREALILAIDACISRIKELRDEFLMPKNRHEQGMWQLMERAIDGLLVVRDQANSAQL